MIIDAINLNHLRIFECVYRTNSMTKAANELHMTQSGVSQHIKLLEEILEIRLFDRVKQRLIPTTSAKELFESSSQGLRLIEKSLSKIKGGDRKLGGEIHIGIPVEFGNNIILPLLAKFGSQHQDIHFNIKYGLTAEMNYLLLKGEIDFAFVDDYSMDKQITLTRVYDETLSLCASEEYMRPFKSKVVDKKFFESLSYLDYIKSDSILKHWFDHHYQWNNIKLNIRAYLIDVQGQSKLIAEGLGVGVIPGHQIEKFKKQNFSLHIFNENKDPLINSISMASVNGRTYSPSALALMDYIEKALQKK